MLSHQALESQARAVLERLHGYTHRQEWLATDQRFMVSLLQDWDEQVTQLLGERDALRRENEALAELNRWNEWRLAGQGFGNYLKFLLGINKCPS